MPRPVLRGERVALRPPTPDDRVPLAAILGEPEVARWWGADAEGTAAELVEDGDASTFVIEVEGERAGAIQYTEENDPDYRHAAIDLFLATAYQDRGLGSDAVRTLARHLLADRGHHRLTIDPAAANERAIRAYERVGFRRVGLMRRYERAPDGRWRDGLLLDLLAGELRD